jgi:hypothetical protein
VRKDTRVDFLAALFGRLGNNGEKDERVIQKIVFTVSSYARGNFLSSKQFFDLGGVDRLFEACKRAPGVCKRIHTLFTDLTDPNMVRTGLFYGRWTKRNR